MNRHAPVRSLFDELSKAISKCQRCGQALDRVWLVISGSNACIWCLHPILPHKPFEASRALARMENATQLIAELILHEDARARGENP